MKNIAADDSDWVGAVYNFGNKFVHLTDAHNYAEIDLFQAYEHKDEVIEHHNRYRNDRIRDRSLHAGRRRRICSARARQDRLESELLYRTPVGNSGPERLIIR